MQRYLKKQKSVKVPETDDRGNESSESLMSESSDESMSDRESKNDYKLKLNKLKMENNTETNGDPFVFWAPFDKEFKEDTRFFLLNDKMKNSMQIDLEDHVTNIPDGIIGSSSPWKYFEAFFPENFIEYLTCQTNLYADQIIEMMQKENRLFRFSRVRRWKSVTKVDIKKYIGIVLWTGFISNKDLKGKERIIKDTIYSILNFNNA